MDVVRRADWIVDVGPGAGEGGGRIVYSGPVAGLRDVDDSATRPVPFPRRARRRPREPPRSRPAGCGCAGSTGTTCATSTSTCRWACSPRSPACPAPASRRWSPRWWPRSSRDHLGVPAPASPTTTPRRSRPAPVDGHDRRRRRPRPGRLRPAGARGPEADRPHARAPTSPPTPACSTPYARCSRTPTRRGPAATTRAGSRSTCASGRCPTCQGEGFVTVELIFLPGTYAPCPTCHGARYDPETLEITYRGATIADVLAMTVDDAAAFLADVPGGRPQPAHPARGRPRLPAAGPAGHRAVRRRGAADQARHRAAARPPRAHPLPAGRADHRPAPGRRRAADAASCTASSTPGTR